MHFVVGPKEQPKSTRGSMSVCAIKCEYDGEWVFECSIRGWECKGAQCVHKTFSAVCVICSIHSVTQKETKTISRNLCEYLRNWCQTN